MLLLIFLSSVVCWQQNLYAAASSSTDVQPTGLTQEQLHRIGTFEPGFVRTEQGKIKLVGYYPDDAAAVAQLIEHTENFPKKYDLFMRSCDVQLLTTCEHPYQGYPTLDLAFVGDHTVAASKQIERGVLWLMAKTIFNLGRKEFIDGDVRIYDHPCPGRFIKIINYLNFTYLSRGMDGSYYKNYIDSTALVRQRSPYAPTDWAVASNNFDWLATVEGGKQVNIYRCPVIESTVGNNVEDTSTDLLAALPHEFERNENNKITYAALNLFTQPEDDAEPLICSFAFSSSIFSRLLALIFPRSVMLWYLHAHDKNKTIQARGKVIVRANLADDTPSDQLSCFSAGVFSPCMKDERNSNLYIASNNSVVRYSCANGTVDRVPYPALPGLSGKRLIAISPDGERLAVADPRVGVTVFDTKTMALLCTLMQDAPCKHIALLHSEHHDLLATSVQHDDGRSEEKVWKLVQRENHPSLQHICFDLLGRSQ